MTFLLTIHKFKTKYRDFFSRLSFSINQQLEGNKYYYIKYSNESFTIPYCPFLGQLRSNFSTRYRDSNERPLCRKCWKIRRKTFQQSQRWRMDYLDLSISHSKRSDYHNRCFYEKRSQHANGMWVEAHKFIKN